MIENGCVEGAAEITSDRHSLHCQIFYILPMSPTTAQNSAFDTKKFQNALASIEEQVPTVLMSMKKPVVADARRKLTQLQSPAAASKRKLKKQTSLPRFSHYLEKNKTFTPKAAVISFAQGRLTPGEARKLVRRQSLPAVADQPLQSAESIQEARMEAHRQIQMLKQRKVAELIQQGVDLTRLASTPKELDRLIETSIVAQLQNRGNQTTRARSATTPGRYGTAPPKRRPVSRTESSPRKRRGSYKCRRCGGAKKDHHCTVDPKLVSVAQQVDLSITRQNIIQPNLSHHVLICRKWSETK